MLPFLKDFNYNQQESKITFHASTYECNKNFLDRHKLFVSKKYHDEVQLQIKFHFGIKIKQLKFDVM